MDGSYTKRSIRLTKVGIIVYTADNHFIYFKKVLVVIFFILKIGKNFHNKHLLLLQKSTGSHFIYFKKVPVPTHPAYLSGQELT